jgi:hypothetical protein
LDRDKRGCNVIEFVTNIVFVTKYVRMSATEVDVFEKDYVREHWYRHRSLHFAEAGRLLTFPDLCAKRRAYANIRRSHRGSGLAEQSLKLVQKSGANVSFHPKPTPAS